MHTENDRPTISIIVPVYNTEERLSECIESVLEQTYDDFELILIDDGSEDKSPIICDEYAKKDNRVQVYHQKNAGVSTARNIGIVKSNGQYVTFIDSDDYIEKTFLEEGMDYLLDHIEYDIFCFGYIRQIRNNKFGVSISQDICKRVNHFSEEEIIELLKKNYIASTWGKIYKRAIIGQNRFDVQMKFGEDLKFVFGLLEKNPLIYASHKEKYVYKAFEGSLTSITDEKKCKNALQVYNILLNFGNLHHYKKNAMYYRYVAERWKSDFLCMENAVLKENRNFFKKVKKIKILCSDQNLVSLLLRFDDIYIKKIATHPLKIVVGYTINQKKIKGKKNDT